MNRLESLLAHPRFERAILMLILVNAITLGLETDAAIMARHGALLTLLDRVILTVFVAEVGLRILAYRWQFWRDPWRIFDFVIVGLALVPSGGNTSILRVLRVLRVLRLISVMPSLRRVVGGLVAALPGMGSIVMLLGLLFYVFAVMATGIYGQAFPEWFGSIGASAYSLFQIMTLESWSMGIVRPVMTEFPHAWAFFVVFILCTSFTVLNLFIGIIVSAMQSEHETEASEERDALHREQQQILSELRAIRARLDKIPASSTEHPLN